MNLYIQFIDRLISVPYIFLRNGFRNVMHTEPTLDFILSLLGPILRQSNIHRYNLFP
jgi:hypothetical protein